MNPTLETSIGGRSSQGTAAAAVCPHLTARPRRRTRPRHRPLQERRGRGGEQTSVRRRTQPAEPPRDTRPRRLPRPPQRTPVRPHLTRLGAPRALPEPSRNLPPVNPGGLREPDSPVHCARFEIDGMADLMGKDARQPRERRALVHPHVDRPIVRPVQTPMSAPTGTDRRRDRRHRNIDGQVTDRDRDRSDRDALSDNNRQRRTRQRHTPLPGPFLQQRRRDRRRFATVREHRTFDANVPPRPSRSPEDTPLGRLAVHETRGGRRDKNSRHRTETVPWAATTSRWASGPVARRLPFRTVRS